MKIKLLTYAIAATFLKSVFIPQFASAQNSRIWGTYYGGGIDSALTIGSSVATDAAGNVYLAGSTANPDSIAWGGYKDTLAGGIGIQNAFLVKFTANGNRLWATYYGGTINTVGNSVATDAAGNVYLAGTTYDTIGIASGGFMNNLVGGQSNAFLVKFDANGNRLWATYYGGAGGDQGNSVATDAAGNVYIAGLTTSTDSIASGGFQNTFGGGFWDSYLVKFNANGNRLWATYYGGFLDEAYCVATDFAGNVYMAGQTTDTTGIASGGFQNTFGGGNGFYGDAYLVKFDGAGNRLWGTYYGGAGNDIGWSAVADATGNVYLSGVTSSTDSISSGGFKDTCINCPQTFCSSFLVKFDAGGNRLCASYYGEFANEDQRTSLALDNAGNVYMGSSTADTTGGDIASGGFQNTYNGLHGRTKMKNHDAYLVKFTSCVLDFQSSDTTFCSGNCIDFMDISTINATSWQWNFPGGAPSSSTVQNPQGICYNAPGTYNAMLIAFNGGASDTLVVTNLIHVFPSPPTPVITQHQDTLYCSTDPTYTSYQWYDNSTLIPGATDTFLVVTHGGNFNVAVNNEYGCQISVGITIVLGIQNYSNDNHIILSPNPAGNQLTVVIANEVKQSLALDIYNVLGEKVYRQSAIKNPQSAIQIDVSALSPGIYFVQVTAEKERWTGRFVKE